MKCSYGERGSLTATCVRANASFFRTTSYRFDQLDETLKCLNCTLKTIESNTFDISGNRIKNLLLQNSQIEMLKQKAFIGLIFLETLDLSYNDIRSVYPGTFTGIKEIKNIDLSYNKINILSDDGFLELINLEQLNIERNNIRTISTKAFNGLNKLRILKLKHNQIAEISNVFSNLTTLQVLDLEYNQLSTLSGLEFENLTALLELNLAMNKIQEPNLQITPNNNLRNLYLTGNNMKCIKPDFLKTLHKLEVLDVSYNYIEYLNYKDLQNLYDIRILNMSSNVLTTIYTGALTGLPHLEMLNISNNKITEIVVTGVFSLHSLHSLDISHNYLKDLDYVGLISRLPMLTYLKLDNNLLPCGLEHEMEQYFEEDNFKFVFYEPQIGTVKCIDEPIKTRKQVAEKYIQEEYSKQTIGGGLEITMLVLICIIILSVGYLYYLQYRAYQGMKISSTNRALSSVNLVASEAENRGNNDFA